MSMSQTVSWRQAGRDHQLMSSVPGNSNVPSDLILIIDDSITVQTIAEVSLRRAGYTCVSFADGISALRWLQEEAPRVPRLLLLDLGLPGMDGYQIARTIRANPRWNEMVIVMLTGRDRATDRLKGHLVGARLYLTKPFQIERLIAIVQSTLHGAQPAVW